MTNLRGLRIGIRLGLGIGLIVLILVASQLVGGIVSSKNRHQMADALKLANTKAVYVGEMKSALFESGIAIRNIGVLSEVAEMQKEEDKVKANSKRLAESRDKLAAMGLTETEKAIIGEITRLEKEIDAPLKEAMARAAAFDSAAAAKVISEKIDPLNTAAVKQMDKLVEYQQAASAAVLEDANAQAVMLMKIFALVGLGAIGLAAVIGWLLTRSITRPLTDAVEQARKVAAGELTTKVVVTGKDEVSQLLQALRDMTESLSTIVGDVRGGTETITVASREIASGNADLSSRTESQASSLEETASSMEELTTTVKQNAENARQANQLVASASENAVKGGEVVEQVVGMMGSIKDSSNKIVDIISVIDGIAFQTNILALNAAVEAARAGEQGRGFAVVAAEVRSLAQRSASAAKEIKVLINDSVEKVDGGSRLVDQAGKTMDEIVTSVKRVADIMSEISAASQEQSVGIEEVNRAIRQMDDMTQQNAALVEEAAAAAQSMQEQASRLAQTVSVFRLEAGAAARAAASPATLATAAPASLRAPKVPSAPMARKPVVASFPSSPKRPANLPARQPAKTSDSEWEEF